MSKKRCIIPVFIPHKGCPHDCVFCNQKKISGQIKEISAAEIRSIIQSCLAVIKNPSKVEIAFYGGSFTGIEIDKAVYICKT